MLKGLKFEPRTTSWTRDDVNQVNKLLDNISKYVNTLPTTAGGSVSNSSTTNQSTQLVNIEDSGVGPPSPPSMGGTVLTDGLTITGDGVSEDIALIYPNPFFSLIGGPGITISGTWPNQTVSNSAIADIPCNPHPMIVQTLAFGYSPYTQPLPFYASTQFDCIDKVLTLPIGDSPYSATL
jgi:hypothetical protein